MRVDLKFITGILAAVALLQRNRWGELRWSYKIENDPMEVAQQSANYLHIANQNIITNKRR